MVGALGVSGGMGVTLKAEGGKAKVRTGITQTSDWRMMSLSWEGLEFTAEEFAFLITQIV